MSQSARTDLKRKAGCPHPPLCSSGMAACQVGERAGPPNFHCLLEKAQPGCGEVLRLRSGIRRGFVKDSPLGPGLSWSCLGVQPETRTPSLGCHMQLPSGDPGTVFSGTRWQAPMFSSLRWVWARRAQVSEDSGMQGAPTCGRPEFGARSCSHPWSPLVWTKHSHSDTLEIARRNMYGEIWISED